MTETTATQDFVNDVKIEEAGPAKKRITITIPAESVQERMVESLETLAHEAALPGFRKGKAPRALIEKRFGSSVRNEAKNQLIADAYSKALEDNKIRVVGEPEATEGFTDIQLEDGKPLTFAVDVEIVPQFDLPKLDGVEIRKPVVEITDGHIDEELARQLLRHGEPMEVTKEIAGGDRLGGTAVITNAEDSTEIVSMPEAIVFVPREDEQEKGHMLGLKIEGMTALLTGKNVGDTVEVTTTGPENHERDDLRGKPLKISYTISAAMRIKPATPEQLIEMYGLGDGDKLREQLKIALEDRARQEQSAAMREQVYQYLLDHVNFDLPAKLSARQAQRLLDITRIDLLYRGMSVEDVEARLADLRAQSESEAQRRLKLFFTLHAIGDHFEVTVNEQEVNGRIAQMALQRGERPEQFRATLQRENRIQEVAMQIREHKTADRVIDQAVVTDISAEEWNAMVSKLPPAGAASETKKKSSSKKKKD